MTTAMSTNVLLRFRITIASFAMLSAEVRCLAFAKSRSDTHVFDMSKAKKHVVFVGNEAEDIFHAQGFKISHTEPWAPLILQLKEQGHRVSCYTAPEQAKPCTAGGADWFDIGSLQQLGYIDDPVSFVKQLQQVLQADVLIYDISKPGLNGSCHFTHPDFTGQLPTIASSPCATLSTDVIKQQVLPGARLIIQHCPSLQAVDNWEDLCTLGDPTLRKGDEEDSMIRQARFSNLDEVDVPMIFNGPGAIGSSNIITPLETFNPELYQMLQGHSRTTKKVCYASFGVVNDDLLIHTYSALFQLAEQFNEQIVLVVDLYNFAKHHPDRVEEFKHWWEEQNCSSEETTIPSNVVFTTAPQKSILLSGFIKLFISHLGQTLFLKVLWPGFLSSDCLPNSLGILSATLSSSTRGGLGWSVLVPLRRRT